jgi:hypothetical protein
VPQQRSTIVTLVFDARQQEKSHVVSLLVRKEFSPK